MIVKNETRVIGRLLESVLPLIDTWVIVDTGSTDATPDYIKTFLSVLHDKPGHLLHEPFRDFGYNRSHALSAACHLVPDADWFLLMDADMVLRCPDAAALRTLLDNYRKGSKTAALHMMQGGDAFQTKNIRWVQNDARISYWGVTHEYVKLPPDATLHLVPPEVARIHDVGDGGSKGDKADRDIRLLKAGLEALPDNDRYLFYLANTYCDKGMVEEAINTYERRIHVGGWHEETWYCYYKVGHCCKRLGNDAKALQMWLQAVEVMPHRWENVYEIVKHYRVEGQNKLAAAFYEMAQQMRCKETQEVPDYLFTQRNVYRYLLDYECTIFGYYWNPTGRDLQALSMKLLARDDVDAVTHASLLRNYKFYAPSLCRKRGVQRWTVSLPATDPLWNVSTPSIAWQGKDVWVNVREVNYRIDDKGQYVQAEGMPVTTRNWMGLLELGKDSAEVIERHELQYDVAKDNEAYAGLEDLRLFASRNGGLLYTANRGLGRGHMVVEMGSIEMDGLAQVYRTEKSRWLQLEDAGTPVRPIEKNWVLFSPQEGVVKVVYEWHPLTIGSVNQGTHGLHVEARHPTSQLFGSVRGSSHGIHMKDGKEIWFLCHVVSYEDRRYYYHLFVVLDADTHTLLRHSVLFTFAGEPVEYSCGFVDLFPWEGKEALLIGFSRMDRTTELVEVPYREIPWV